MTFDIYRLLLPEEFYVNKCIQVDHDITEFQTIEEISKEMNLFIDWDYHKDLYGFPLSQQEINNYLSHYKIWSFFLNTGKDFCMIVESNVEISIQGSILKELIKSLPEDTDIFFPYDRIESHKLSKEKIKSMINSNIFELHNTELYAGGINKWGNSIYILSKQGAKKLTETIHIKDRLDNTIFSLSMNNALNLYYDNVSWFKEDLIDWTEWPERNFIMWNQLLKMSPWNEMSKKTAQNILKVVSEIALKYDIKLILQGGTHLGYIQHNGIMLWDDDIDIGISEESLDFFLEKLDTLEDICFDTFIEKMTDTAYFKIWSKKGSPIEGYEYTFPFIDLWVYNIVYPDYVFKNGIICPDSAKYELDKVLFEGAYYYITGNSLEVLDSRYSSWRDEIRVYPYSHKLERGYFPNFRIKIKTDRKGRMIKVE